MTKTKFAPGAPVTVGERRYFIDGVPAEFQKQSEFYLAQNNINVFYARHLDEHTEPAAAMRSWFPAKQPTESQVRGAMLWLYDSFGDYGIKAGGGTLSDSIFISHLTITVADSRSGADRDVVLLKKHSQLFSEVLITIEEVERLERATETKARARAVRLNNLPLILRELIVWEKGIRRGGFTEHHINQMLNEARGNYGETEITEGLERVSRYAGSFETRSINGGFGRDFLNHIAALIAQGKLPGELVQFGSSKITSGSRGNKFTRDRSPKLLGGQQFQPGLTGL